MRHSVSLILVSTALLLGPISEPPAHAQATEPTATELAEGASRAHALGRLDEAITGYQRAYQVSGDASLLFSLAETQREAGRDAEALRTFQTYLRRDPEALHRESAAKQVKELEQKLRGKPTAVPVTTNPPLAAPAPRAPSAVPPSIPASPQAPVRPPSPASSLHPSAVRPTSPVPPTPTTTVAPAQWPESLSLPPVVPLLPTSSIADSSGRTTAGVDLATQSEPPKSKDERPPLPRWVPWAGAVATVALGTVAIVSGLSASRRFDDLKGSCGQTASGCAADQVSDLRSRARTVSIFWALAGAAAVGTGITVYVNTSAAGAAGLWAF